MSVRQSFAARVAAATLVVSVLVVGSPAALGAAAPRSGDLVVAKECSGFAPTNNPPYCQITSASLKQIEVDSKIFYLDPNGLGTPAGGAVVLDLPGPGNNRAFGRCFLGGDPMHCEFSGGTGKFTWFHASVVVTVTGAGTPTELWHWVGTYDFSPH
jgi:hypothetical protein